MIQNPILRDTYIHDCTQRIGINEATLINQMNTFIRNRRSGSSTAVQSGDRSAMTSAPNHGAPLIQPVNPQLQASKVERMLMQMVVRHGEHVIYKNVEDEDGHLLNLTVAQFIQYSLDADNLKFQQSVFNDILAETVSRCDTPGFRAEPYFLHHEDIQISRMATEMATDAYHLTPQKDSEPIDDEERERRAEAETEELRHQTEHLLLDFRMDYVEQHLKDLMEQMKKASGDMERLKKIMEDYRDMQDIRNKLATQLGNNIIV